MCFRANATSKIIGWSNQPYGLNVTLTGASNACMFSAKLYITYTYDDSAANNVVKTVHYPMFNVTADGGKTGTASFLAQRMAGYNTFYYYINIPETGATIQQAWYEIRGFKQSNAAAAVGYINTQIPGSAAMPQMLLTGSSIDSYKFRYLSSTATPAGFAANTSQTLSVITSSNAITNILGGEVVVTYSCPPPATVSPYLKTVSYFLTQSTGSTTDPANFSAPIYLNEEGAVVQRIYAMISGSYNTTATPLSLTVNSSIGGNALTARTYSIATSVTQISGFDFIHDMSQGANYLIYGSTVNINWNTNATLGGLGIELFITYTSTGTTRFTDNYKVFAGQSPTQTTNGTYWSYALPLFFPNPTTPLGLEKLDSAFLRADIIQGAATVTANPQSTIYVNALGAAETVEHYSTTDNFQTSVLYDFSKLITPSSTTATADYTLSNNPFNVAALASVAYNYTPVPSSPTVLAQYQNNGTTLIATGTYTNNTNPILKFTMTGQFGGDVLYPVVEYASITSTFNGVNLTTGTPQTYNWSPLTGQVQISTGQGQYQWRASVVGSGGRSNWTYCTSTGTMAFGIDTSSPPAPVLSSPGNGYATNNRTPQFTWNASADIGGSGTTDYYIQVATSTDFGNVIFSSETLLLYATPTTAFNQNYNNVYYWHVRARDTVGNIGVYSSTFSVIVDTSPPPPVATLSTPLDNLTTNQITLNFTWTGVTDSPAGIANYILQVSTNPNFGIINYSSWVVTNAATLTLVTSSYTWRVNTMDNALNYTTSTAKYFVTVDSTPPPAVSVLTAPLNNLATSQMTLNFNWTGVSAPPSGLKNYILEVSTAADFSGTIYSSWVVLNTATLTLNQSSYTWRVNAMDNAMNYTTSTFVSTVIVDTTPPPAVATLGTPLNNSTTNQITLNFTWTGVTDSPAGIANYILQVSTDPNFGIINYSSSVVTNSATLTLLTSSYTWRVNTMDNALNYTTSTAKYFVTVDSTPPPAVSLLTAPLNNLATNQMTLNFNWTGVTSPPAGLKNYILEVSTDPAFGIINYSSWVVLNTASLTLITSSYTWRVNTMDNAMNYTTSTFVSTVIVDTTPPPAVSLLAAPLNNLATNQMTLNFSWTGVSAPPSGVKNYILEVSTDPAFGIINYSSWVVLNTASLTLITSSYTWRVNTMDNAMNYTTSTFVSTVIVDTTPPPAVSLLAAPLNNLATNQMTLNFSWTGVSAPPSGVKNYILEVSTDPAFGIINYSSWVVLNTASLTLVTSSYTWRVNTMDNAMNYTTSTFVSTVIVDTTPPPAVSLLTAPLNNLATNQMTLNFNWTGVTSPPSGIRNYIIEASTAADFSGTIYSTWVWTNSGALTLNQSSYTWRVNTMDYAMNYTTAAVKWAVVVDTTPPPGVTAISSPVNNLITNQMTQNFNWTGVTDTPAGLKNYILQVSTDPAFGIINYSSWVVLNTATLTLNESSYTWRVNTMDNALNYTTSTVNFFVSVDTTPPTCIDSQSGDNTWRTTNNGAYAVYFKDAITGSGVKGFDIYASTVPSYGSPALVNWTQVLTTSTYYYNQNWGIPNAFWNQLPSGPNKIYISARCYDFAYNTSTVLADAFYVLVDTYGPNIVSNQPGDNTWRNLGGTTYSVNFYDPNSLLQGGQYIVRTGTMTTSTPWAYGWQQIFISTGTPAYTTPWQVNFGNLSEGTNYVFAQSSDTAGLITQSTAPVFYVNKDISQPIIINGQPGDYQWRSSSGTVYGVFFTDAFSGCATAQYQITDVNSNVLVSWQNIFAGTTTYNSYYSSWSITSAAFNSLYEGTTNLVYTRVYDGAGNLTTAPSPDFFILKDTHVPRCVVNVSSYSYSNSTWHMNINFFDDPTPGRTPGCSGLASAQYSMTSSTGGVIIATTPIAGLTSGATYFTSPWQINFDALPGNATSIWFNYCSRPGGQHFNLRKRFYCIQAGHHPANNNQQPDRRFQLVHLKPNVCKPAL